MTSLSDFPIRIGYGYDIHRLESMSPQGKGKTFKLGGVRIKHTVGPVGKTDADTLFHALTDALLGALALGSMGDIFPKNGLKESKKDSQLFLLEAYRRIRELGWKIGNVDITIVLEEPQLKPYINSIKKNLSMLLLLNLQQVNVKVKSHEKLDMIGKGRAVEVHAHTLLHKEI